MQPTTTPRDDRSLGELFKELAQETGMLVRQEVKLAKTELLEKINQVQRGLVSLAMGGLVAFVGLQALVAAAIAGLSLVISVWLSALIVGIVILLVGLVLMGKGRESLKADKLALSRTAESLEEDKQWAQAQMK